jgi:DNA-binding CsgD family transcriptional regulator
MRKITATAGSAVFLLIAPGVVAGLVPWWLTGWQAGATPLPDAKPAARPLAEDIRQAPYRRRRANPTSPKRPSSIRSVIATTEDSRQEPPLCALASASPPGFALPSSLTAREAEILRLIAAGLTNTEIAERLFISPLTCKSHVSRILTKLDARDRTQLVVLAYECGLIVPGKSSGLPGAPLQS